MGDDDHREPTRRQGGSGLWTIGAGVHGSAGRAGDSVESSRFVVFR
jgi:hypothetical protein